jgi:hypothetical protein
MASPTYLARVYRGGTVFSIRQHNLCTLDSQVIPDCPQCLAWHLRYSYTCPRFNLVQVLMCALHTLFYPASGDRLHLRTLEYASR